MKRRSTKVSSQASRKGRRVRKQMKESRDVLSDFITRLGATSKKNEIKLSVPISDYLPNPFLTME